MRILIAVGLAGLAAAGCVNLSRSQPVTALSGAEGYRVGEVRLQLEDGITATPEFATIFRDRVQAELNECATGSRPLRVEAEVTRLDRANPVQVALLGGANVLRGDARLVDPATGRTVGEYQIGRTVVGARFAVFEMAESEEQLSEAFGQELCEQAFGAD